ncbi:hypothetical protein ACIP80_19485 [Streptomyces sp. NPDC088555]|uniref:hypothetical protein n=1 Tax=Streptomyces sp. NPDC088555 TaxID=3365866 RepID=UPI00382DA715
MAVAVAVDGRIPSMRRSAIAGRRAMISGGAVRRGRTAAGRARWSETGSGAASACSCEADAEAWAATGAALPEEAEREEAEREEAEREGEEREDEEREDEEREGTVVVPLDRWTVAEPGCPPVLPLPALPATLPATAAVGPVTGPASSSAPVRAARSSSGPPGDSERALPGRVTPWMRPTGADGRTAWPSSLPNARFCHEARPSLNRRPSLTPIEERATVTAGGATCRQPPSQSPPG